MHPGRKWLTPGTMGGGGISASLHAKLTTVLVTSKHNTLRDLDWTMTACGPSLAMGMLSMGEGPKQTDKVEAGP